MSNKRFNSSTFFPISRKLDPNAPSALIQCLNSSLPVFSRDVGKHGAKTFLACGYIFFVEKYYPSQKDKHLYEVLQFDKPTKIYFDFDAPGVHTQEFQNSINSFMHVVKAEIKTCFQLSPKIYILDATTESKCSYHVIVDLFLKDIPSVKDFVLHCSNKHHCEYLDVSVYSRNRSFRLLYSRKLGKGIESSLKLRDGLRYDSGLVLNTMIQCFIPPHLGLTPSRGPFQFKTSETRNKNGYTSGTVSNVPKKLYSFLINFKADLVSVKENDKFVSCIVANMNCPWNGRPHKSNNHYLTINKNSWKGWFECSDPDCPKAAFHEFDALWIFND